MIKLIDILLEANESQADRLTPSGLGDVDLKLAIKEIVKKALAEKIKGVDGKACWKGYRYAGTKNGKDICIKITK